MTEQKSKRKRPAGAGRAPHIPDKHTRDTVSLHAMVGTPEDNIASVLGITKPTLRKHYKEELKTSADKANAAIGGTLYNKAKSGDTAAMIFWMKTRARWRETNHLDISSSDQSLRPAVIRMVGADDETKK